jgi:hypothetical protein
MVEKQAGDDTRSDRWDENQVRAQPQSQTLGDSNMNGYQHDLKPKRAAKREALSLDLSSKREIRIPNRWRQSIGGEQREARCQVARAARAAHRWWPERDTRTGGATPIEKGKLEQ